MRPHISTRGCARPSLRHTGVEILSTDIWTHSPNEKKTAKNTSLQCVTFTFLMHNQFINLLIHSLINSIINSLILSFTQVPCCRRWAWSLSHSRKSCTFTTQQQNVSSRDLWHSNWDISFGFLIQDPTNSLLSGKPNN